MNVTRVAIFASLKSKKQSYFMVGDVIVLTYTKVEK